MINGGLKTLFQKHRFITWNVNELERILEVAAPYFMVLVHHLSVYMQGMWSPARQSNPGPFE